LTNMTPQIRNILTNHDVIAIDQDQLGKQGERVYADGEVEVWMRHLTGGAVAVAVLNAGDSRYATHPFHLSLERLGLGGAQQAKDLWTGKDLTLTENMPLEIAGHDVLLVRIAAPK
jgi:alpha-galactosidase